MSCDVGDVAERLENELILQTFRHFTYVTTHYPTLPSLYLRHNSFSNPSVVSPMSQFILQPFFRFSYATSSSLNSPGEPTMGLSLQTQHSPLYPLLSLPFRIYIQSIYHNVVYHLICSAAKHHPVYHSL